MPLRVQHGRPKTPRAGPTNGGEENGAEKRDWLLSSRGAGNGPSGGETGGKDDVNLDERMGSNKPRKDGKGDLVSDPGRIQRDLDLYQDEMAQDSPASGSPDDNP